MKIRYILQTLALPSFLVSCTTPSDPGRDAVLLRPSLTRAKIRFQAGLQSEAAVRASAQGLPVPENTILEPNTDFKQGLSLGYGGYSLSMSKSQPLSEAAIAEQGNTRSVDYQFHGALSWLGIDTYWQEYKGMHDIRRLSTQEQTATASATLHEYHPDLELARQGLNLFYINDTKNYKHNAHMYQTEYQPDSADSLLFLISFDHLKLLNLPASIQEKYQESLPSNSLETSALSMMLGYAFILKSKHGPWFAANFFAGRSYQYQTSIEHLLESRSTPIVSNKAIVSSSLGIDRASWFLGLGFWVDSITIPTKRMDTTFNTSIYEFFMGCRL